MTRPDALNVIKLIIPKDIIVMASGGEMFKLSYSVLVCEVLDG